MIRIDIAPTRSNLIRIKQELQFAREGYEILDRKREALTAELIQVAHEAEKLQRKVWAQLADAYAAMERAQLLMGQEGVEWAALAANKTVEVTAKFRGVMGVTIPVIEARGELPEMLYSLGDVSSSLDETTSDFRQVLSEIPELSKLVTSVWRLARELRKTKRRVNALQYIFIPDYEETVAFIRSALEEREREEVFRLKKLKKKTVTPVGEERPAEDIYEKTFLEVTGDITTEQFG